MSKKIKVLVRDKNTLVLDEAAGIGDIIDLTELKEFDSTALEAAIDAGKERVYEQKLNELKQVFNLEKNQEVNKLNAEINLLKNQQQAALKELEHNVENKYKDQINELKNDLISLKNLQEAKLKEIKSNDELDKLKALQLKDNAYNELLIQYQNLENKLKIALDAKEKEIKAQYELKVNNLVNEKEILLAKFELEKNKVIEETKGSYEKIVKEKEDYINALQRQKASLNVKQTGEDLESWCDNTVKEQMQNGFYNCTWEKDNKVIKEEHETKGSKADYIFKIYADKDHDSQELLASVCLEMKDENPDSVVKQTNEHYYAALDKNRNKKACQYAILVSNLEMDNKSNILPVFKVREYENMYVVRPGYLMTFLNMITSLTTRFSELILSKEEEKVSIKDKLALIEEFNSIKKTYLEKPLDALQKDIEAIIKANEAISNASRKIEDHCNHVISQYINQIDMKLSKFELNINKKIK